MTEYRFHKTDSQTVGIIEINPARYYTQEAGIGFYTERSRDSSKRCALPELNTGFIPASWFQQETVIRQDIHGCYVDSLSVMEELKLPEDRRMPLSFQADTKTGGIFRLALSLYAKEEEKEVLVFAGRRQLVWRGSLMADEEWNGSFLLSLCDIIPRGEETRYKDQTVQVTVISRSVRLASLGIESFSSKTLFIAGDSTVTDQSAEYPYAPGTSYSGWGQMLPAFLNGVMAVSNHAHSGLTTESFRAEGHWQIILDSINPGDICLFQFGHNDQKLSHLKAEEGYRENLIRYIREIREREAMPVLVTPLARNSWKGNDGEYNDLLKGYADEVNQLGESMHVPVLDLHEQSMAFIKEHGLEDSKRWFYPSDYTHTNDYGAWKMAEFIWEELIRTGLVKADGIIKTEWDPPEVIKALPVPERLSSKEDVPKEEIRVPERPDETLTRAEALELVIQTVHYFPINVYNDLFRDVIGHEWFAGTVECAVQNGLIPVEMVEDGCFYPNRAITLEEFLWIAMTGYKSRKQLPKEPVIKTEGTLLYTRELINRACALGAADPADNWKRSMTRREAASILGRFGI